MPIIFHHDDHELDVDDVPLSVYAEIEKSTGVAWYQLTANPMRHAAAGEELAKACAKQLGVELPALTPKLLVKVFEIRQGENRPTEFDEGMPDPKAPDSDQATT